VDAVDAVKGAALWGALLAVAVLILFLRTFSRTLLVALAIPVSVITTFLLMDRAGITLNLMSLGGLALGVGMLVDNAIVVLESIERRRTEIPGEEGVARGAGEVARAVTASTLTTLAVFGPVLFVVGVAGQLFGDLAATVCFALAASLIVALALIPSASGVMVRGGGMLAGMDHDYFTLRDGEERKRWRVLLPFRWIAGWIGRGGTFVLRILRLAVESVLRWAWKGLDFLYAPLRGVWAGVEKLYPHLLEVAIRNRWLVLLCAAAVFVLAMLALPFMGAEILPEVYEGEFAAQIRLPEGASLQTTAEVVQALERRIQGDPLVERVLSRVGSLGASSQVADPRGENLAEVLVTVAAPRTVEREEAAAANVREALSAFPDLSYTIRRPTSLSLETPVEVDVFGDELERVGEHAMRLAERLAAVPVLSDVRTSAEPGHPEVLVVFDRERLAALGLTAEEASTALRHAVRGEIATELRMGDERIDVRVRVKESARKRAAQIPSLVVAHREGSPVRLASVADIVTERGPASIQRLEQQRVARITAVPKGVDLGSALAAVREALADVPAPPDVSVSIAGQSEEMRRSYRSLGLALVLAVFLVFVVLASNFESLLQPFLILFSVPLALVGAVLALWLMGHSLSILVLLGAVMLAGIVVNNAIVLLDAVNRQRDAGASREDAVRQAGAIRLRPIMMTTLTTVLGLAPMAFGLGAGDELRAPMAVTVIGGLLVSTLLTLLVIPAAVLVFDRRRPHAEEAA
jgi:HAE1 family hydrophobic/amphiphilic exporter-1